MIYFLLSACFMFVQKVLYNVLLCKNIFAWFAKLTALLEYLDLVQNFHVRNFCIVLASKIYFPTKIKRILLQ